MKTQIKLTFQQALAFFYTIAWTECPRCRTDEMLPPSTFNNRKFADIYPEGYCCEQIFKPESGFYLGAMYLSFAFSAVVRW